MSENSQIGNKNAKLSHQGYLVRCNIPQQVPSLPTSINLVLKSDTLIRLQNSTIASTSEQSNSMTSAPNNQQVFQMQLQNSSGLRSSSSIEKRSASDGFNSQGRILYRRTKVVIKPVLCKNCGVPSRNLQICSSCSKPIRIVTNGMEVKTRSDQSNTKETSSTRSLNASKFYGGSGLNEFARFVEGSQDQRRKRTQGSRRAFRTNAAECIMIIDSSDEESVVNVDASASSGEGVSIDAVANSKEKCLSENGAPSTKKPKVQQSNDKIPTWQCHAIHVVIKSIHAGQKKLLPATAMRISGVGFSVSMNDSIFELKWFAIKLLELSSNPMEPCLYLTVKEDCLGSFRSELELHPGKFPYYDPNGPGDQKYIIFYIDKQWFQNHHHQLRNMLLEFRTNLKMPKGFFKEITVAESSRRQAEAAQSSLEREDEAAAQNGHFPAKGAPVLSPLRKAQPPAPGTPRASHPPPSSPPTRVSPRTRSCKTERKDVSICFSGPRIQLAIYPSPPAKGGIVITNEDEFCLNDEEFLNDVIIDFYLKYTMEEIVSKSDRDRSHVFSSFFYKRLTQTTQGSSQTHEDKQLSTQEKRHARVRKWSRGVDLFSKDFVFIPINDSSHWYLAVICFPGRLGNAVAKADYAKQVAKEDVLGLKLENVRSLRRPQTSRTLSTSSPAPSGSNQKKLSTTNQYADAKQDVPRQQMCIVDPGYADSSSSDEAMDCDMSLTEQSQTMNQSKPVDAQLDSVTPSVNPVSGDDDDDDMIIEVSIGGNSADCNGSGDPSSKSETGCENLRSNLRLHNASGLKNGAESVHNTRSRSCKSNSAENALETSNENSTDHGKLPGSQFPCILLFNSLRSTGRSQTSIILREYLTEEWKYRKSEECGERTFTPANMKMCTPHVPQQDNYFDCGLFLLHYVEQMFKNPIKDFTLPLKSLQHWFNPDEVKSKRSKIRKVIQDLSKMQSV